MQKTSLILMVGLCFIGASSQSFSDRHHIKWTVIGAGPTGIMSVGLILDSGVPTEDIMWVDSKFNVGRMGEYYKNVPGNGRVEQYIAFLNRCNTFTALKSEAIDHLYSLPLEQAPALKVLVDPLLDITNYLRTQVASIQDEMVTLNFHDDQWEITTKTTRFSSDNVVLATGAHPKALQYEGIPQIPLDMALDKEKLAKLINRDDSIAIIGSGHSALLILKYLTELSVERIVNFYNKPITYPVRMRKGIAWQEAGLKGDVAVWAKTVLEANPPKNVVRVQNTPQSMQELLPQCTKVIYAVGFERNELPPINGDTSIYTNYDRASGIIGPRLYGVGIAFPQQKVDPLGNVEYLVGLPYVTFDGLIEALNPVGSQQPSKPENK